tara:strand:- start:1437 stop:2234 length:798 start_codon:yes stop_codon:yes gene_type:complete
MDLLIGGIAGTISRTLTAPLELYKIQQQNTFLKNNISSVIKNEGFRHLWKGNMTNIIRIFPQMSLNYALYKYSQKQFSKTSLSQDMINLISGALSGSISITVIYPLETIRTRLSLQTNKKHYTGIYDIVKKTKFIDLYGGLRMTIIGFTPYNALHFMFYQKYKTYFKQNTLSDNYGYLLAGGLSGMSALSITYPSDLIRRRLQLQNMSSDIPKYTGIYDVITKIIKKNGIRGLYNGLLPAYCKIFPTIAIQFYVIEQLSTFTAPY